MIIFYYEEPVEEATVSLSMLSCLSNNNPADGEDEDDDEIEQNEFLSLLPKCVLPRLEKLKLLHEAREGILEEYQKERAILEAKFSKQMKPLYEERRRIVVGEKDEEIRKEVDSKKGGNEEAEKEKEGVVEDVVSDEEEGENEENVKGIPQFWACAIGHVDVIAELITEGKSMHGENISVTIGWFATMCKVIKNTYLFAIQLFVIDFCSYFHFSVALILFSDISFVHPLQIQYQKQLFFIPADVDCLDFLMDVTCEDFPDGVSIAIILFISHYVIIYHCILEFYFYLLRISY